MLEVTTHHQPSPQKHNNNNKRKKNQLVREAGRGLRERGRYGLVRRLMRRHVPQICSCEVFWRVLDSPGGPRYCAAWAHEVPSLHPRSEREKDKKNNNKTKGDESYEEKQYESLNWAELAESHHWIGVCTMSAWGVFEWGERMAP